MLNIKSKSSLSLISIFYFRIINGSDYVLYPLNTQSEYKGARGKIIVGITHFLVVERSNYTYYIKHKI